jgi:hemin uptake protein HemP
MMDRVNSTPYPTATAVADSDPREAYRAPPVPSTQLLQGRRVVEIAHNGEVYRLQATRLGKLILTK